MRDVRRYFYMMTAMLRHPRIAFLGFTEGPGDSGVTFNDDPSCWQSVAYDSGRNVRRMGK